MLGHAHTQTRGATMAQQLIHSGVRLLINFPGIGKTPLLYSRPQTPARSRLPRTQRMFLRSATANSSLTKTILARAELVQPSTAEESLRFGLRAQASSPLLP